jgi:hypothetical protein
MSANSSPASLEGTVTHVVVEGRPQKGVRGRRSHLQGPARDPPTSGFLRPGRHLSTSASRPARIAGTAPCGLPAPPQGGPEDRRYPPAPRSVLVSAVSLDHACSRRAGRQRLGRQSKTAGCFVSALVAAWLMTITVIAVATSDHSRAIAAPSFGPLQAGQGWTNPAPGQGDRDYTQSEAGQRRSPGRSRRRQR